MTMRALPALTVPQPKADVRFDYHPQARERWDRAITHTARQDENTISILEPIGVDFWSGEGVTAKRVAAALRSIGDKPVTVLINSPGGDFFEGLAIYNMLREHPKEVTVQILGIAASAASTIALAGDTIQIAKAGLVFVHNTQWFAAGDRHVMQQAADDMAKFDEVAAGLVADRAGVDSKQAHKWMDAETFFTGEGAVEAGLADELLPRDAARNPEASGVLPPAYRFEALLEKHGVPRAERRAAMREFLEVKPGADPDNGMPGATDFAEATAHFQAEAMRLSLTR